MELEKLQGDVIKAVYVKIGKNYSDVSTQDGKINVVSATNNLVNTPKKITATPMTATLTPGI